MKKKIALLLVMAMVLSLIPVSAFGATVLYVPAEENPKVPANVLDYLEIDLADLDPEVELGEGPIVGETMGYPILIELSGGARFGIDRNAENNYRFTTGSGLVEDDNAGGVSARAAQQFIVSYSYEGGYGGRGDWEDDQMVVFIQLFDATTGNYVNIPDGLAEGEIVINLQFPIYLGSGSLTAELDLIDLADGDASPFENFPRRIVGQPAEDIIDDLVNGAIDLPDVLGKYDLPALDDEEWDAELILSDTGIEDRLADLENAYAGEKNIDVEQMPKLDENALSYFGDDASKYSVIGAALSVDDEDTNITLDFSEPAAPMPIPSNYNVNSAVQVDIKLAFVNGADITPKSLMTITVPIPGELSEENLYILHYADDETFELLPTRVNNSDRTCTFWVNGFSVFAFVNLAANDTPEDTEDDSRSSSTSGGRNRNPRPDRQPTPSSDTITTATAVTVVERNWQISAGADPAAGTQSAARIDMSVSLDNSNSYRASVKDVMIKEAVQQASSYINKVRKADPTAGLFMEVNIAPEAAPAGNASGTFVGIEAWALESLSAAGLGLAVNAPDAYFKLDAAAVKELCGLKKPSYTFVVKPVAHPSLSVSQAVNGRKAYEISINDLFGQKISGFALGSVELGIAYQPAEGESAESLSPAQVSGGKAVAVAEGSYDGEWLTWKNIVDGIFTATVND